MKITHAVTAIFAVLKSNSWVPYRALSMLLVGMAALWAIPRSARGQIYVSNGFDRVGKYDATTGAAINANFITGLSQPTGLALSGNNLFVADYSNNSVGKYDATTGATINADFITGLQSPLALASSGNILFVAYDRTVGKYDATTGAAINANFITVDVYFLGLALSGNN